MHAGATSYLETEILTASPEKLRLKLIEAAIRHIQRTRLSWEAENDEKAWESLIRAQEIVTELLASINLDADPRLCRRVAALYVFIFRSLVEAGMRRSREKLDDALRVLYEEQRTWQAVCEKHAQAIQRSDSTIPLPNASPKSSPQPFPNAEPLEGPAGGLSLEV